MQDISISTEERRVFGGNGRLEGGVCAGEGVGREQAWMRCARFALAVEDFQFLPPAPGRPGTLTKRTVDFFEKVFVDIQPVLPP